MSTEKEILESIEKLKSLTNAINAPLYNFKEASEIKVQILLDNKIKNGLFVPDKFKENVWYTNKQTYRAMKKDLFDVHPEELKKEYQCYSCNEIIDLQFWLHCPHCESSIKE